MSTSLVSVVIPCFRQGHLLAESIDSALGQTHPAIEVVVVNDGSDDDTDRIARGYGDRIKYVAQRNSGLPAARNAGIRLSSGEYLLFLDSDDRLDPRGVERLVSAAGPRRLVIGGFKYFSDDPHAVVPDRPGSSREQLIEGLSDEQALLVANLASPCAHLCPRSAALEIGLFDTDQRYYGCEDWDFWTRLVLHGLVVRRIPEVVSYYRLHASSMTKKNEVRMGESAVRLLQRNCRVVSDGQMWPKSGTERRDLIGRIRLKLRKELLNLSYVHRCENRTGPAMGALFRAVGWGGPSYRDVSEAVKILAAGARRKVFGNQGQEERTRGARK